MPSSVPASSSVRDTCRVDAVQPNAFLSSNGSRSGLSLKELRMGVQAPGEGKSDPGDPLVTSPLDKSVGAFPHGHHQFDSNIKMSSLLLKEFRQ